MVNLIEYINNFSVEAVQLFMTLAIIIFVQVIINCVLLICCQGLDEENIKYRERDNQLIEKGSWL